MNLWLSHFRLLQHTGPDFGLGKLGSCPGASATRGPPYFFFYSWVEWTPTAPLLRAAIGASTAPLLRDAQGPPHV